MSSSTRFDRVWESYVFDRRLRLLVMDVIERIRRCGDGRLQRERRGADDRAA